MFVDPENNDFRLREGSPAIGTGRYGGDRGAIPYGPYTGIYEESDSKLLSNYELISAYPNPFNSKAIIKYFLPTAGYVKLEIFNIIGQKETVLIEGHFTAGQHSAFWNASDEQSGVYFLRLTSGQYTATNKMVLVK